VDLKNIIIYRITHIENIPHILKNGITHINSPNKNPDFKNIGDVSLIDTRSTKTVFVDNGDCELISNKTITLGDFIPFYFGVRMPMLFVAQNGGNFVEKPTPAEDIIYIGSSLKNIIENGNEFYFSDGHATDMFTTFFDKSKINELVNIVDWTAIKSSYWGGADNLNLKRKKQAEFLVLGDIAVKHIIGFGCYNDQAKNRLTAVGIDEKKIKIIPKAYY
jgi:hypothetical protein